MRKSPALFREKIVWRVRANSEITKAVDMAATKHIMTRSEYIRRALIERLQRDGQLLRA
jgi:hypothetical protein